MASLIKTRPRMRVSAGASGAWHETKCRYRGVPQGQVERDTCPKVEGCRWHEMHPSEPALLAALEVGNVFG